MNEILVIALTGLAFIGVFLFVLTVSGELWRDINETPDE